MQVEKSFLQWTMDENRMAQYDVRARNIILSALTLDDFFKVSVYESAQEMWEFLRVTHDEVSNVARLTCSNSCSTSNSSSSSNSNEQENLCLMANDKSSESKILKEKKDYQGSSSSFRC
ncbi:hypothetical protein VIGAN_11160800, partial [Vigna angularis var. angularis]